MTNKGKVKTILIIFLLLFPLSSFASDKNIVLHFGLSTILGGAAESYLHYETHLGSPERILYGTLIGSFPGLAKEVIDSSNADNHFSGSDMVANVAGAFVGAVIANFVNNKIQINVDSQRKKVTVTLLYKF
jgi:VanZ family protein